MKESLRTIEKNKLTLKKFYSISKPVPISKKKTKSFGFAGRLKNSEFIKCGICYLKIPKFASSKIFKCENCFSVAHLDCLKHSKEILFSLFDQNRFVKIENKDLCACSIEQEKNRFISKECSLCGLDTKNSDFLAPKGLIKTQKRCHIYCALLSKTNNFTTNNKKCYLCGLRSSREKNLLRCDFHEEDNCKNYFHIHCALSHNKFHWISIRENLIDLIPKQKGCSVRTEKLFKSPIIRCSKHSFKIDVKPQNKHSDSKKIQKTQYGRFIPDFVFDEANLNDEKCSVCFLSNYWGHDMLIVCENPLCEIVVHQKCYGVPNIDRSPWFCNVCRKGERKTAQCCFCNFKGGALKEITLGKHIKHQKINKYSKGLKNKKWIHVGCAILHPKIRIGNPYLMDSINRDIIEDTCNLSNSKSKNINCDICGQNEDFGFLIECNQNNCSKKFHSMCALRSETSVEFEVQCDIPSELKNPIFCSNRNIKLFLRPSSSINGVVYCGDHSSKLKSKKFGKFLSDLSFNNWIINPRSCKEDRRCSLSPLKKFFEIPDEKSYEEVKRKILFSDKNELSTMSEKIESKDALRKITISKNFDEMNTIEVIKSLQILDNVAQCKELENNVVRKKFFEHKRKIMESEYLFFLKALNLKPGIAKKISSSVREQEICNLKTFVHRCLSTGCLKSSKFSIFCHSCGNDTLSLPRNKKVIKNYENHKKRKNNEKNANYTTNLMVRKLIIKSLGFILEICENSDRNGRKDILRNGGDILFLLRNVICSTPRKSEIKKYAEEVYSKIKKMVELKLNLFDNSSASNLLVYVELIHARKTLEGEEHIKAVEIHQIKRTLSRFFVSEIIPFNENHRKILFNVKVKKCEDCGTVVSKLKRGKCGKCGANNYYEANTFDIDSVCSSMIWLSVFNDLNVPFVTKDANLNLKNVLVFLKEIRPYRKIVTLGTTLYKKQCYFVTHLVFIASKGRSGERLNSWGRSQINPAKILIEEFIFLVYNMSVVVSLKDPELVGEFLHCLRIFGLDKRHPSVVEGITFLLEWVKEGKKFKKGGWVSSTDFYTMYHAAYCAIAGLGSFENFEFDKFGRNDDKDLIEFGNFLMGDEGCCLQGDV